MNAIINSFLPTLIILQGPLMDNLEGVKNSPTWLKLLVAVWLFCGVVLLILYIFTKPQAEQVQSSTQGAIQGSPVQKEETAQPVGSIIYSSTPSAADIAKDIDSQPPYLRPQFSRNYHGLNVNWQGKFRSVRQTPGDQKDDQVDVLIRIDDYNYVSCTVSLREYPLLRTLKSDAPISVKGTIVSIKIDIFELSNAKLDIHQSATTPHK